MSALQNDPDIREAEFSLEEKLTIQQVRFVGVRLRDLLIRYETASLLALLVNSPNSRPIMPYLRSMA